MRQFLLDTHAAKLGAEAIDVIGDPEAAILVSAASAWEIAIKHRIGRLTKIGKHRDPLDRLVAAQGLMEDAVVVTRDREIAAFGCEVLW